MAALCDDNEAKGRMVVARQVAAEKIMKKKTVFRNILRNRRTNQCSNSNVSANKSRRRFHLIQIFNYNASFWNEVDLALDFFVLFYPLSLLLQHGHLHVEGPTNWRGR
jgi:hypothetical protein